MLSPEVLGKDLFQASLDGSLVCGNITPIFTWYSPYVCVPFYKDSSQVGLEVLITLV